MIDFPKLFVHVLVSPFKSQAWLEAEILFLRHQLNVVRRDAERACSPSVIDSRRLMAITSEEPTSSLASYGSAA